MPNLSTVDWLILLLYCTSVLGIGFSLKPFTDTRGDFFQAGRAQPAWICALAFLAASLGAPEILLMGAAGAQYGLAAACFFALGAVPAMLFLGLYLMPLYYGSGARTVPEYLRLRFDRKTGVLNAVLFVAMSLCTAGLSLYLMATVFQSLHVFDRFFENLGWYQHGSFAVVIALSVLVVAAYVLLGGLAGSIYSQVVQFFLMVAGLLPVVFLGLRGAGGWSGLKASLPAASSGNGPIAIALGLVFAAGFWCTDFRVIQSALAARDVDAARRTPLLAALLRIFVPSCLSCPAWWLSVCPPRTAPPPSPPPPTAPSSTRSTSSHPRLPPAADWSLHSSTRAPANPSTPQPASRSSTTRWPSPTSSCTFCPLAFWVLRLPPCWPAA